MSDPSADVVIRTQGLGKSFLIGSKAKKESFLGTTHRLLTGTGSRRVLWALRHLDLEVRRGETLGIIGPNGAGKSTLLLMLGRILAPSEGRVDISGKTDQFFGLDEGLHSQLTVRENMSLCAALLGMPQEVFEKRMPAMLAFSKLDDYLYAKFGELSTGLAARVAFSVAIHGDLDIILVEEKLAVGDHAFQDKCLSVFRDFQKQGKTLLIVSHSLKLIDRLCPRTLYLNAGRAAFLGDTAEAIRLFIQDCGGALPEPRPGPRRAEPPQAAPVPPVPPPAPALPAVPVPPPAPAPPAVPVPPPAPAPPAVPDPDALLEEFRDGVRAELQRDREGRSGAWSRRLDLTVGQIKDRLEAFKADWLQTAADTLAKRQTACLDAHWEERSAAFAKKLDAAWLQSEARQKADLDSQWEQRSAAFMKRLDQAMGQMANRLEELRVGWMKTLDEAPETALEAPSAEAAGLPTKAAASLRRQTLEEEVYRAWPATLRHTGPIKAHGTFNDAFLFLLCQLTAPASGPRLRPGDEVITTAANMPIVSYLAAFGLVPVFVDLDPASYNLDPSQLEKARSPATRAVLATCLAGSIPDLERLRSFCDEHQLLLIECAPYHLGCQYGSRMLGTWGDLSCAGTGLSEGLPEALGLALTLARPELGEIFAQPALRPKTLPDVLRYPAPVTTLGLSLALESSRRLSGAAKLRKAAIAELRACCASYSDLLTLPELPARFSADTEGFTAIVKESSPLSMAELAAALTEASLTPLHSNFRIGSQMKRIFGVAPRHIGSLPNTTSLLARGLNIVVDEQSPKAVAAALARVAGSHPNA